MSSCYYVAYGSDEADNTGNKTLVVKGPFGSHADAEDWASEFITIFGHVVFASHHFFNESPGVFDPYGRVQSNVGQTTSTGPYIVRQGHALGLSAIGPFENADQAYGWLIRDAEVGTASVMVVPLTNPFKILQSEKIYPTPEEIVTAQSRVMV